MALLSWLVRAELFFVKARTTSVSLVTMSLSGTSTSTRCSRNMKIYCMALDEWNPASPLVNFVSLKI